MQFSAKQIFWMAFMSVAMQGLTSLTWSSVPVPKDLQWVFTFAASFISYAQGLVLWIIGTQGTKPATSVGIATPAVTNAPKAVIALLIGAGLVAALLMTGPAQAQPKFPPLPFKSPAQLNQSIDADIKAKIAQFEQVTIADLTAAKQIFDAAKNANGAACAAAWLSLAQANATIDAAALPDPHVFSFLAKAYNLHVALQPNAALRTACAAMKDDLNGGLLGIGGGAAAVTKLVPALALFGL